MRAVCAAFAAVGVGAALWGARLDAPQIVLITGDTRGYLSPCGCTTPMIGGIRRRATALRRLSAPERTTILDVGGWVDGVGRQDELKAQTLAQSAAAAGATLVNLTVAEAKLGRGEVMQLSRLSSGRLSTLSVQRPEEFDLAATVTSGPFLIGSASAQPDALARAVGGAPISLDEAVAGLVQAAKDAELRPVLVLDGDRSRAAALARRFPDLVLIAYRSTGTPTSNLDRIGNTALATIGEHGKYVGRLTWGAGGFEAFRAIPLGPEFPDDPEVSRFYASYLRRVTSERLLEKNPRRATPSFSGSWSCAPCHPGASRVWKSSAHRHALETLEKSGHGRDPDCVPCHVVGLESTKGFRARGSTPHLADVGCESCHGPSLAHARDPRQPLPKAGERSCLSCHNPQNSPSFDFASYWKKIAH